jgi:Flp pilus assembly pilin Flp
MKPIKSFIKDQAGAEIAEYAIGVALLVAIGMIVYSVLGQAIADQNSGTGAKVKGVPRSFPF